MNQPYKMLTLEQGSPEWLEFRKSKIMASDSPVIMEASPYNTPYKLWCQKQGICEPDFNDAMAFGKNMEPVIRRKVSDKLNTEFTPCVVQSTLVDWAGASLDGFSENGDTAIEIKCANAEDHEMALKERVPHKYYAQVQKQMFVLGIDIVFYVSYHKEDIKIFEVDRDQDYIDLLLNKEKIFYDCVQNFTAPDLTDKDYVKRVDIEFKEAVERWKESKDLLKQYEQNEKKNRDFLINLCQNKSSEGYGIKVSKSIRRGNVDYSSIPQLAEIDLEPYRKASSESWRIYA